MIIKLNNNAGGAQLSSLLVLHVNTRNGRCAETAIAKPFEPDMASTIDRKAFGFCNKIEM